MRLTNSYRVGLFIVHEKHLSGLKDSKMIAASPLQSSKSLSISPRWASTCFKSCRKPTLPCSTQRYKLQMPLLHALQGSHENTPLSDAPNQEHVELVGKVDVEWIGMLAVIGLVSYFQFLDPCMADSMVSGDEAVHSSQIFSLAEGEDFWSNMASYGRFFISVMTGTTYVILKPVLGLLRRPRTAIFVVIGAALLYFGLRATVDAMLGLTDLGYSPSVYGV